MRYLIPACIFLTGCAASVISTSPRTVIIDANSQGPAAVQKLADAECAKHGRYAQLKNRPAFGSNEHVFDCVL